MAARSEVRLLFAIVGVALLIFIGLVLSGVFLLDDLDMAFAPGMGLRAASLWGFGVTVALMVLFALVSGDSLIGEIQFMLGSFFTFFVVITLLIAWVF